MKRVDLLSYKMATLSLGMLTAWMLFVYALSYHPFITESYLPVPIRIGIEGFVLYLLVMINIRYQYLVDVIWFIPIIMIFGCVLLLEMDTFVKLISSFNKLVLLILAIGLLIRNRRVLNTCIKIWILLSYFLCVAAILAFVGYNTGIIPFSPLDFGESINGVPGSYYYMHNAILGNLRSRQLLGLEFGRATGFMYEEIFFSFFLGFNILVARDWIDDPKKRKRFVRLNLITGITAFSTTFFLFFSLYFLVKKILGGKKMTIGVKTFAFLFLGVLSIGLILSSNYFGQTSASVRLDRMNMYFSIIENSTWLTLLLGNGVGIAGVKLGIGFDSGWIAILVERGVIMLVFMVSLVVKCTKHNRWLMFYIFYFNFALDVFWYPLFLLLIAMSYACFNHKRKQSVVPSCLPGSPTTCVFSAYPETTVTSA